MPIVDLIARGIAAVRGPSANITVRETYWGFVVRSSRPAPESADFARLARFLRVGVWPVALGLVVLPAGPLALRAVLAVLLVGAVHLGLAIARRREGYELHVDTNRRELRSAVLTAKGEIWVQNSARFDEVQEPVLRRGRPDPRKCCLSLRIRGEAEPFPVASGDETTLLAVHDRLMRDLMPLEKRLAGLAFGARTAAAGRGRVFPQLGPEEIAA